MQLALGLIETKGLIGAIEAADAMAKAADVKIINKEKSTAALITIKIEGEVAAVKSAIDAGAAAAQRVGQLVASHIIPRPHSDIDFIITQTEKVSSPEPDKAKKVKSPKTVRTTEETEVSESKSFKDVKETVVKTNAPVKLDEQEDHDKTLEETADESQFTENVISEENEPSSTIEVGDEAMDTIVEDSADEEFIPETEDEDEVVQPDPRSHLDKLREEARSELDQVEEETDESDEDKIPPMEELEKLNVHALRKLARSIESFPIKGREISKANRRMLLDYLSKYI